MKNKNFTTSVVAFLRRSSVLLAAVLFFVLQQNVFAQPTCPLSSNNLVQVSLKDNCQAIVTPEMVIEGEGPHCVGLYKIFTIVDENGDEVGFAQTDATGAETGNWILEGDKNYYDQILMASVRFKYDEDGNPTDDNDNFTMGGLYLEDKMKPALRCLDTVFVSCSEVISNYLTTDTDAYYARNEKVSMRVLKWDAALGGYYSADVINSFPVKLNPFDYVKITFNVDNRAMQSEIIEYVAPEFIKNLKFKLETPSNNEKDQNDLKKDNTNYFYGMQATDDSISGVWTLFVYNGNSNVTLKDDVKLHVKSKRFALSIGDNLVGDDNCHNEDLKIKILSDVIEDNDVACGDWFKERKIRYQAIDWVGNKSDVCEHVIRWEKKGLDDFEWPLNYDGVDTFPLSCTGNFMTKLPTGDLDTITDKWDANGDGYPQPEEIDVPKIDGFPVYPDNNFCMVNVTYSDDVREDCPGSYKILRKWVAYDMCKSGGDDCCSDDANPKTHYQIINVVNINKPVFSADMADTVLFSTSTFKCESDCDLLPAPVLHSYKGCGGDLTYDLLYCPEGDGVYKYIGKDIAIDKQQRICDLPFGETCITYVVKDECGNQADGNLVVIVVDDVPPVPVCDEHTVATVITNCTARVKAHTFDDGSIDNCDEDLEFEVAKANSSGSPVGSFGDYVEYGSSDVGKTRHVVLKVIDDAGNSNTCSVEVYIDDKIYPTITCPENDTIFCGEDPYDVENTGGKPEYWDNCLSSAKLQGPDYTGTLNRCGVGTITRTWKVVDGTGKDASCSQKIHVKRQYINPPLFPGDKTIYECNTNRTDPSYTGKPLIQDDFCSMMASTYTDRVFNVVQGACYKILRDWVVIDWCLYEENVPDSPGIWKKTQVIKVHDTENPVFTAGCENKEFPAYNSDCTGDVDITADADDCTPDDELVWKYTVYNSDNTVYATGDKNRFKREHMPTGAYKVHWLVEDKCGNFSECDMNLTVKDAKNPTPLCYSEITTVVMPSTDPKMVVVNAKDFDRGSDDNCDKGVTCGDCDTDLRFSFSGTNPNVKTKTFTDADVGIQHLEMWVWDRAGNRDFCNVTLHVQDNQGSPDGIVQVGGSVKTTDDKVIEGASVTVEDVNLNETVGGAKIGTNGYYEFGLSTNSDYEITVNKEDNCLNGLSTLDIVLIQKQILGFNTLNSPYKLLAADVNMDGKLTASDILEIRKLILGRIETFSSADSWAFINKGFKFDDPKHPWIDSENGLYGIVLDDVQQNSVANDFVGLKLGDVNNSVVLNGTSQDIETRGVKSLTIDNVMFEAGEYVSVPVYGSELGSISGLQMSVSVDGDAMEFVSVEAGAMKISTGNYLIKGNQMNISWNASTSTYNDDDVLFTLKLKSKKDGQLINRLQMSDRISPEVYDDEFDVYSVALNYRNEYDKVGQFVLYQNTPNPFSNETEISFEIPENGVVTISVYDITGKEIVNISRDFEKGYNSVIVSKDDLKNAAGVLYYKVENDGNTIIKKMIVISK